MPATMARALLTLCPSIACPSRASGPYGTRDVQHGGGVLRSGGPGLPDRGVFARARAISHVPSSPSGPALYPVALWVSALIAPSFLRHDDPERREGKIRLTVTLEPTSRKQEESSDAVDVDVEQRGALGDGHELWETCCQMVRPDEIDVLMAKTDERETAEAMTPRT